MCSLRFENNLLTIECVRFASISNKTALSKLSFPFVSLALPLLYKNSISGEHTNFEKFPYCFKVPTVPGTLQVVTFCNLLFFQTPPPPVIIYTVGNIGEIKKYMSKIYYRPLVQTMMQHFHTAKTKCRKFETNILRKGISGPQSQFPHSRVCEQPIYSHDGSACSAGGIM